MTTNAISHPFISSAIMIESYFRSFGIGVIAGMRAMSAPALLSHKLTQLTSVQPLQQPAQFLAQPAVATSLKALAGGEMIADKLPSAPNRTIPSSFITRIASGATCGGVISEIEGRSVPFGAVAGGIGAVVGTLAFFNLRRWLDHDLDLPDTVGALAEDALVVGVGWTLVDGIQPAPQPVE